MPHVPTGPRPNCPVCSDPCGISVGRPARWLYTCGRPGCVGETRARKTRGNIYGNTGGGPARTPNPSYGAIHARARRTIGQSCALADATCSGRIEAALRADVPRELITWSPRGPYYAGLNTEDAYRPLCRSHHAREGTLRAAAERSPAVAGAVARDRLAVEHECAPECPACTAVAAFDAAAAACVALETRALTRAADRSTAV